MKFSLAALLRVVGMSLVAAQRPVPYQLVPPTVHPVSSPVNDPIASIENPSTVWPTSTLEWGYQEDYMYPVQDLEIGSLCEDAQTNAITMGDDAALLLTGEHSKMYRFPQCYSYNDHFAAASVYEIEGTGEMMEVSLFSGADGESNHITVLEGCVELHEDAINFGATDFPGVCVDDHSRSGARWMTTAGTKYTIIIHSYSSRYHSEFVVRLANVEGLEICGIGGDTPVPMMNLGSVSIDSAVKQVDLTDDGVLVTDLPVCDYVAAASTKLYKVTIDADNALVNVVVEGGDAHVTVYGGACTDGGYSCLVVEDPVYPDIEPDISNGVPLTGAEPSMSLFDPPTEMDAGTYDESKSRLIETKQTSTPRWNYNMHSFDNEIAGTEYLLAVSTPLGGAASSDFRLIVNASAYGDVCQDAMAVDLSAEFSDSLDGVNKVPYKGLFSCYSYWGHCGKEEGCSYFEPGEAIHGQVAMFSFEANGGGILATIGKDDWDRFYHVRMMLFEAETCEADLVCVGGDDYNNVLYKDTKEGATYYVAVYSEYGSIDGATLTIDPMTLVDPCELATPIDVPLSGAMTGEGSIVGEGYFVNRHMCGYHVNMARSKVYSFTATADGAVIGSVKASVQPNDYGRGNRFYPLMSVSLGACGSSECPKGFSTIYLDGGGGASWSVTAGETYFITVFTTDLHNVGDFELKLEPLITTSYCNSEDVADLGTIPESGLSVEGTTEMAAYYSDLYKCEYEEWKHFEESPEEFEYATEEDLHQRMEYYRITSRAAVYTFMGDGKTYSISLVDAFYFSSQLNVYSGSCGDFTCIRDSYYYNYNSKSVETVEGVLYTIVVNDCCSMTGAGSFKLVIENVESGDVETNAPTLAGPFEGGIRLVGSTSSGLAYASLPYCYTSIQSPAVLYKIAGGNGMGYMSASVTGFGFEAQIAVFKKASYHGYESSTYECVGNHNWREVSWSGETEDVYLAVYGCCDSTAAGDYVLRITEVGESTDMCSTVKTLGDLPSEGITMEGSTSDGAVLSLNGEEGDYFSRSMPGQCFYDGHYFYGQSSSPVVAYSMEGTGEMMMASLYVENGGNDAVVTVMTGECGALECTPGAFSSVYSSRSLTFPSVQGQTYFVMVSSCCNMGADVDYLLKVETTNMTMMIDDPFFFSRPDESLRGEYPPVEESMEQRNESSAVTSSGPAGARDGDGVETQVQEGEELFNVSVQSMGPGDESNETAVPTMESNETDAVPGNETENSVIPDEATPDGATESTLDTSPRTSSSSTSHWMNSVLLTSLVVLAMRMMI